MITLDFTFQELDEIRAALARSIEAKQDTIDRFAREGMDSGILEGYLEHTKALYNKVNEALKY